MSPPDRSTPGPRPDDDRRMRPTNPATLVVAGLAAAAVSWLVIANFYGELPPVPWLPPITILALAMAEAVLAVNTRARIERRPGTPRIDPLAAARYVVLAKASALAGAIFAGVYAGMLVWLLVERGRDVAAAASDTPPTVVGLVATLALIAAGLRLERACRVPGPPPDEGPPAGGDRQHGSGTGR